MVPEDPPPQNLARLNTNVICPVLESNDALSI